MRMLGLSWSLGRLRGVDVRFHFSMLFSIPIAYLLFKPADTRGIVEATLWVIGFVLFIVLHEMGHAFAAQMVGVEVKSIMVWLLGGLTNLAYKPEKPLHNLFIYAAGPLMNMLLAFLCVAFYIVTVRLALPFSLQPGTYIWVQTLQGLFFSLAVVNLVLVVFNLIPVYPLDGGNILHASMEWLFGKSRADTITLIVSIPFLVLLIVLGFRAHDYILLMFCVLIAISIGTLNRSLLRYINLGLNYLFRRAGYYYLQGDYDRAAQMYTYEIDKQPNNATNYLARASCYLLMGQKARALADIERALKINPSQAFAIQLRGEIKMLEKNYEAALQDFAHAQALNPHWAVPYFDRGSLFLDRKEFQPALESLNKAVSLQSRLPLFYVVRSLAHFRLSDLKSAHEDEDTAVSLSPNDSLVMVDLNLILYEENLDWATDYYERILAQNPRNGLALQGFADACRINREFSHAVDLYSRAIDLNPREPRLFLGRGKCYLELNEPVKAKADFEKALSITDKVHLKRQTEELLKQMEVAPKIQVTSELEIP